MVTTCIAGNRPNSVSISGREANVVDTSAVTIGMVHHSDFISTPEGAADLCRVASGAPDLENGRDAVPGHIGRWVLKKAPE